MMLKGDSAARHRRWPDALAQPASLRVGVRPRAFSATQGGAPRRLAEWHRAASANSRRAPRRPASPPIAPRSTDGASGATATPARSAPEEHRAIRRGVCGRRLRSRRPAPGRRAAAPPPRGPSTRRVAVADLLVAAYQRKMARVGPRVPAHDVGNGAKTRVGCGGGHGRPVWRCALVGRRACIVPSGARAVRDGTSARLAGEILAPSHAMPRHSAGAVGSGKMKPGSNPMRQWRGR